ncbi:MAG: thioredoxin TrxC [Gammaproteobacteria bacterium]|nr:thioredoxin TrxC [Gammaproteobacteria bacterium]
MANPVHIVCPHCHSINRLPADKPHERAKCGSCQHKLFDGHPINLGAEHFQRHLQHNDIPLLVDFWAPWCGPCRMMAPVFEQAAAQLEPSIRLLKVNTEEQTPLAQQFSIRSIPTLALLRHGREIARQAGATDLSGLLRFVQQHR